MEKYQLSNISIYYNDDSLFISQGDHHLVQVSGNEKDLIKKVVAVFDVGRSFNEGFKKARDNYGIDEDDFRNALSWLIEYNILLKAPPKSGSKEVSVSLYGPFHNAVEANRSFVKHLSSDQVKFNLREFYSSITKGKINAEKFCTGADCIIILSPLFDSWSVVEELNRTAYHSGITMMHFGIERSALLIGPILDKQYNTPCFNCFQQRKLVNLDNPQGYWEYIAASGKQRLGGFSISESSYYALFVEFVKHELQKAMLSNLNLSQILGRYARFNAFNYSIKKSRILKVFDCPVCNVHTGYAPFNA